MKKIALLISVMTLLCSCSIAEVVLRQNGDVLSVKNDCYQVTFAGKSGYMMSGLSAGGASCRLSGYMAISSDGEQEKYIESFAAAPKKTLQFQARVKCEVLKNSASGAAIKLSWDFPGGSAADIITFSDGPLIKHDVQMSFSQIMFEAYYNLESPDLSSLQSESIFYPDNARVKSMWFNGFATASPAWKYAWNPVKKLGLGLICPDRQGLSGIHYFMRGAQEGLSGDLTCMKLICSQLRYRKLPAEVKFTFYVIAGGNPAAVEKPASAELPPLKPVTVEKVWPKNLITRINGNNIASIKVCNRSNNIKRVKLETRLEWGIEFKKIIDSRNLELQPGETGEYNVQWSCPPQMQWGMTCRTDAYIDGGLIDSLEEYCAVSDFPPAVAGVSILNPGFCRQEGSEAVWIEQLRHSYVGVIEYYCWYSSAIGGLTPTQDQWNPHTESQGAYNVVLTKKFLKTLIKEAHSNGMCIYAMITGMTNFRNGLEKPELLQYCENGQPSMYNGKIYDNQRFTVANVNAYDEKFAYEWGREMARSVDMFGWDGCRWDWAFIPNAPNDPLYQNKTGDTTLPEWLNDKGLPSRKLYPDPDTVASKALRSWRKAVEEQHPQFVYGTNGFADAAAFRRNPEYCKTAWRKSMLLFEYLLDFSGKELNTWQKWAKNLTEDCQRVRPDGAQPIVGFMRGLLPGSVSMNLAQYICFASGVKWWDDGYALDITDKRYIRMQFMVRFSEYYFDNAFMLIPERRRDKEITVLSSPRVFWRQFVYERPVNNGREVTVHLINLPENDYICQRHEVPPVRENVQISAMPQAGEKLEEAWAMLPHPNPHALKLELKNNTAVLPELTDAAIILLKFNKTEGK